MIKGLQIKGLLLSAAVTLLGALAIGIIAGRLGIDLVSWLWIKRVEWFGIPTVGIWREDPVLGWSHVPNARGRDFKWFAYDVTYRIDESGNRVTEAPAHLPKILFLGCSLTFGHGVEDREAYPSVLQANLPDCKVLNSGVMGWGTAQAFLKLREQLARYDDVRLVAYGFIEHHLQRNYLRKSWIQGLHTEEGRRNPLFTLSGTDLIFRGLVDPGDGVEASSALDQQEKEVTQRLIAEMLRLCSERSIPFAVVHLPNPGLVPTGEQGRLGRVDFGPAIRSIVGDSRYFDLRQRIDYGAVKFRYDYHYRPEGHERIALAVLPEVLRCARSQAPDHPR